MQEPADRRLIGIELERPGEGTAGATLVASAQTRDTFRRVGGRALRREVLRFLEVRDRAATVVGVDTVAAAEQPEFSLGRLLVQRRVHELQTSLRLSRPLVADCAPDHEF